LAEQRGEISSVERCSRHGADIGLRLAGSFALVVREEEQLVSSVE